MSGAQRQAKYRARLALEGRTERRHRPAPPKQQRPDLYPNVMSGSEMMALLYGQDAAVPTMSDTALAALQAMPGGSDPADFDPYAEDDDGQPHPVDEFGEPLDSPDSTLPAGGPYSGR